jgi:hypothetical protein
MVLRPGPQHYRPSVPEQRAGVATGRSGLDAVEVALLDALDLVGAYDDAEPVRCSEVLVAVERLHGLSPDDAWPALLRVGAPWLVHLPLVELMGSIGTQRGDEPAPPPMVEARLSAVGALALAAERGETGPVPIGLVEGTLARGGPVPPFAPWAVVGALLAGSTEAGIPVLPSGGTVTGDIRALLDGEPARLVLGCTVVDEIDRVVITEVPLGVTVGQVVDSLDAELSGRSGSGRTHHGRRREIGSSVHAVRDESSASFGLRLVIDIERRTNVARVHEWLHSLPALRREVECGLPAPMAARLTTWDRGDGSGLRRLADLLRPTP